MALGALEAFREQSKTRVNVRDGTRAAEDPFIHFRLAEAAAEVDGARDRMLANFATMMRLVSSGSEIPLPQRARYRWDAAKATDWSVKAVDRLFEASGGHALLQSEPIQRFYRDAQAACHRETMLLDFAGQAFGRLALAAEPVQL